MNKEELEEYLKKLKEFEKELTDEDDVDDNFADEINKVLGKLLNDVSKEKIESSVNTNVMVKVKKLNQNAVIPTYSKVGDAGMD